MEQTAEISKQNIFISCRESRIESPRSFYGSFSIGPFHSGQSLTIANALRRTLLSEIKGFAITSAQISGAAHEYAILPGVRESVLDILLNLKEIVLKTSSSAKNRLTKSQFATIQVRGGGVVRAKDIKLPIGLQCVDPEQYIATLSDAGELNIQLKIQQGKNYLTQNSTTFRSSLNSKEVQLRQLVLRKLSEIKQNPPNLTDKPLSIDAIFMPILKVNYVIQVEENITFAIQKTQNELSETLPQMYNLKKQANNIIVLDIWTNGSITPRQALATACQKLVQMFASLEKIQVRNSLVFKSLLFSEKNYAKVLEKFEFEMQPKLVNSQLSPPVADTDGKNIQFVAEKFRVYWTRKKLQETAINTLNLSLRCYTCLKRSNIHNLYELIHYSQDELLNIPNFGPKSLEELTLSLNEIGIQFKDS